MDKRLSWILFAAGFLALALGSTPATAQMCAPLDNGRVADAFYEGTLIVWQPVVTYRTMTLTISGPCEDIVRTFGPKDEIMFDIRDIQRVSDGNYTWTLKREADVDPGVTKLLDEVRFSGEEDAVWWQLFQAGKIPAGPYTDSGSFTVERGQIIDPNSGGEKSAALTGKGAASTAGLGSAIAGAGLGSDTAAGGGNPLSTKATVLTNADGVIRNSLCVGFDCPNSPTFSDTTVLLMENNTRIKFDDTSTINAFPRNDWEIEANSNLNGGASYLGFNDCGQSSQGGCATDLVFAVEAGARQNALYVESDGDVGFGTSNPVVRLHTIDGDTPALRLEQDGSSGFAPQTWDVAGNETSFFIRDATNGSTLPFRIEPGVSSNMVYLDSNDRVGIGTSSPSSTLHVRRTNGSANFRVEEASGTEAERTLFNVVNNGNTAFQVDDTSADGSSWQFKVSGPSFRVNKNGTGGDEIVVRDRLDGTGNATLVVNGSVQATNVVFPSSRTLKTDFVALDPTNVLAKVSGLQLSEWRFKDDESGRRHIGPIAEEFEDAFRLGGTGHDLSVIDTGGVALAAVQGLLQELEARDARLEELQGEIDGLKDLVQQLQSDSP